MRALLPLLCLTLLVAACGKKGALIYPELLVPAAPAEVEVRQKDRAMKLSFVLPQKDRAGRGLKDLGGVKIFRRETVAGSDDTCNACTSGFTLFRKLYLDLPVEYAQRFDSRIIVMDEDVRVSFDYSYLLIPFSTAGLDGESASPVMASMVAPPRPPALKVFPAATEIRLEIVPEYLSAEKSTVLGYNVYRTKKGTSFSYLPHNKALLTSRSFVDSGLERNVAYTYAATVLVRTATGAVVESGASDSINAQLLEE